MASPLFQHRHYEFVARTIKALGDTDGDQAKRSAATTFAYTFERDNGRFDRARFLRACGVEG